MENEFEQVSREIRSFADILRSLSTHEHSGDEVPAPNVETIDFDNLCEILDRARSRLEAARKQHLEATAVRRWLTGRIESLRRGQRVIMDERSTEEDTSTLQNASLPEMIRFFEEASASVRASAHAGAIRLRGSNHEYSEFKS